MTSGFCNFSDEGAETTASYGWGTEKETQSRAHPCVWSHARAVLRKESDLPAKQPLLLPRRDTEAAQRDGAVGHPAWLRATQTSEDRSAPVSARNQGCSRRDSRKHLRGPYQNIHLHPAEGPRQWKTVPGRASVQYSWPPLNAWRTTTNKRNSDILNTSFPHSSL